MGHAASNRFDIGRLAVERRVQALALAGRPDLDRRHPFDQPEHSVGEDERPDRRDQDGSKLHEEEVWIAAQETADPRRIESFGREDAAEDDAQEAADAVDAPDVERVVPAEAILE